MSADKNNQGGGFFVLILERTNGEKSPRWSGGSVLLLTPTFTHNLPTPTACSDKSGSNQTLSDCPSDLTQQPESEGAFTLTIILLFRINMKR